MNIQQAREWFDAAIAAMDDDRDRAQETAAYSLARMALEKWEDLLDVEADYKAAAKTAADLQERFCKVVPAVYDRDDIFRCPTCTSYVKWTHFHCPNCGQKLRKETYKIKH